MHDHPFNCLALIKPIVLLTCFLAYQSLKIPKYCPWLKSIIGRKYLLHTQFYWLYAGPNKMVHLIYQFGLDSYGPLETTQDQEETQKKMQKVAPPFNLVSCFLFFSSLCSDEMRWEHIMHERSFDHVGWWLLVKNKMRLYRAENLVFRFTFHHHSSTNRPLCWTKMCVCISSTHMTMTIPIIFWAGSTNPFPTNLLFVLTSTGYLTLDSNSR